MRATPSTLLLAALVLTMGCANLKTSSEERAAGKHDRPTVERIMVVLKPAPKPMWTKTSAILAADHGLTGVAAWIIESLGAPCVIYELPLKADRVDIVARIGRDHRVELAQPVQMFEVLGSESTYNDPYHHLQHGSQTIRAEPAHRWATGKGIRVAVVDTGVDIGHPDLRDRVVEARNFAEQTDTIFSRDTHGTSVVGVIAATANNEIGIVGVAPNSEVLALRACWPTGNSDSSARCDSYTLALAIDFAFTHSVQILNLSIAGPEDPVLSRMLTAALEQGVVVVVARDDNQRSGSTFPASMEGVISVGSFGVKRTDARTVAGLVAPGIDILTTMPQGTYDFVSGSSYAAAHASGVIALLLERAPHLSPAQVNSILVSTANHRIPLQAPDEELLIDACAAIAQVLGRHDCFDP